MWEWLIPVLIVVALVVIAGIYLWATYNSLVAAERARRRSVERHHGPAQTACRSAAEPHRGGEGLRRAREGRVRERHESPGRDALGRRTRRGGCRRGAHAAGAASRCSRSPRRIRSCRRARTSCSCSSRSSTPRTRSRRRAASTTAVCASSTPRSRCSRTTCSPATSGFDEREFFEVVDGAAISRAAAGAVLILIAPDVLRDRAQQAQHLVHPRRVHPRCWPASACSSGGSWATTGG